MRSLIIVILLTALASPVFAVDLPVKWALPTMDTDGKPLVAGSLKHVRLEWGSCAGSETAGWTFGTKAGEILAPDPETSAVVKDLAVGTQYCFRAFSVTDLGDQSASSNVLRRWIAGPRPLPLVISF